MKKALFLLGLFLFISAADQDGQIAYNAVVIFGCFFVLFCVWKSLTVFIKTETPEEQQKTSDPLMNLRADYHRRLAHIRSMPRRYQEAAKDDLDDWFAEESQKLL